MNKLYIGIKGHAVCINKKDGSEVWRSKVMGDRAGVTSIHLDGDSLLVYTYGHLFCLDPNNGNIRWENKLPGLGYSYCVIASQLGSQQSVVTSAAADTQAAAG